MKRSRLGQEIKSLTDTRLDRTIVNQLSQCQILDCKSHRFKERYFLVVFTPWLVSNYNFSEAGVNILWQQLSFLNGYNQFSRLSQAGLYRVAYDLGMEDQIHINFLSLRPET